MNQIIEVIYEGNMFKPLTPVQGLTQNTRTWLIVCPSYNKKEGIESLFGTLSAQEADEMQNCIDKEFSNIEGEW